MPKHGRGARASAALIQRRVAGGPRARVSSSLEASRGARVPQYSGKPLVLCIIRILLYYVLIRKILRNLGSKKKNGGAGPTSDQGCPHAGSSGSGDHRSAAPLHVGRRPRGVSSPATPRADARQPPATACAAPDTAAACSQAYARWVPTGGRRAAPWRRRASRAAGNACGRTCSAAGVAQRAAVSSPPSAVATGCCSRR